MQVSRLRFNRAVRREMFIESRAKNCLARISESQAFTDAGLIVDGNPGYRPLRAYGASDG